MIILTEEQLETYIPPLNRVLVRPDRDVNELSLRTGPDQWMKIFIDSSFEPEKHSPVTGVVMKIPPIRFDKDDFSHSLDWDTDMQLEVGDRVIYSYLQVQKAFRPESQGFIVIHNSLGERVGIAILVRYDQIFVSMRNADIIALNGYVIAEPVMLSNPFGGFYCPTYKDKPHKVKAVVRYVGQRNRAFLDNREDCVLPDDIIGRTVLVDRNRFVPLEYDLHRTMDGGVKKYWKFQRAAIIGVLP